MMVTLVRVSDVEPLPKTILGICFKVFTDALDVRYVRNRSQ